MYKEKMKKWHNKSTLRRDFKENDLGLIIYDAEQGTRFNFLNHMKNLAQIEPMITFGNMLQGFVPLKLLLTWDT